VAPLSAINDKTAATGRKATAHQIDHHVCRIRRLFAATRLLPPARIRSRNTAMKWKTPVIIEIAVGLEINAYACAEIK
jgi:coenzyme PQQ precursor peptide PqqA